MKRESSNKCNGWCGEPRGTIWPPPWLLNANSCEKTGLPPPVDEVSPSPTGKESDAEPPAAEPTAPPPDVSSWDLPPELYERWEERVCIMHYDGMIPWHTAEALALTDVLGRAHPQLGKHETGPTPETAKAEAHEAAAVVQAKLFPTEKGPYSSVR